MLCAIPMEIQDRELDGVLYLALHLAARGMPTLFGERMVNEYVFRLDPHNPVLYFDQDQVVANNQAVLDAGGLVFNLNAEGQNVGFYKELSDLFARIAEQASLIFTRGEHQARTLREVFPAHRREAVVATGHPTFDLLRERFVPFYWDETIAREHGEDFLLINTSFATFNHKMGLEHYSRMMARQKEWAVYGDPAFQARMAEEAKYQGRVAHAFVDMACRLADRFPDRHVIIRPHPMERLSFYRQRTGGRKNLFVDNRGTVRKWLASAGAVIHHDCTTAMEGLLMGKPVLQYRPVEDQEFMAPTQSLVGLPCRDVEALAQGLALGGLSAEAKAAQFRAIAPFVANLEGCASRRIAEYAARLAAGRTSRLPEPLGPWEAFKCWRKHASKLLRARQPGRNGRKVRYALEKFPRLPLEAVRERVRRLRAAEPGLPEVTVRGLALNTFLLVPGAGE